MKDSNGLYKTIAKATLLGALAVNSMGCHFEGFNFGLFSYKRKPRPARIEAFDRIHRKPYIMNDFTCNASLERERNLIRYIQEERINNDSKGVSPFTKEQQEEIFHEEYGALIDSINKSNPVKGVREYIEGNDKVEGAISFSF